MARKYIPVRILVVGTAGAVGKAATAYSESMAFDFAIGHACMFLSSTAGSITVTQQCSLDNTNWYDPVDSDDNALGAVVAAQTVIAGKYIEFDPVMTPYIRFKVVEGNSAATVAAIKLLTQEED